MICSRHIRDIIVPLERVVGFGPHGFAVDVLVLLDNVTSEAFEVFEAASLDWALVLSSWIGGWRWCESIQDLVVDWAHIEHPGLDGLDHVLGRKLLRPVSLDLSPEVLEQRSSGSLEALASKTLLSRINVLLDQLSSVCLELGSSGFRSFGDGCWYNVRECPSTSTKRPTFTLQDAHATLAARDSGRALLSHLGSTLGGHVAGWYFEAFVPAGKCCFQDRSGLFGC